MAVSITLTLTGPFKDEDAQALQMIATGVAIMAGGEIAAQIAANAEAESELMQDLQAAVLHQQQQVEPTVEDDTAPFDLCDKTQEDPLGGPVQVCVSKKGHRGRHAWRTSEAAASLVN